MGYFVDILRTRVECRTTGRIFLCSRLYTKQYMCGIKINNCKKMSKNWGKKVDRAVSLC